MKECPHCGIPVRRLKNEYNSKIFFAPMGIKTIAKVRKKLDGGKTPQKKTPRYISN